MTPEEMKVEIGSMSLYIKQLEGELQQLKNPKDNTMSNEKEDATEEEKSDYVKEFVRLTAEHSLTFFTMMGLKTHIECMVKNDTDGAEYLYSFRKMNEGYIPRIDLLAQTNLKLESELSQVKEERDKLTKFKNYVHDRLDQMGIPTDPEPENNASHGCRIEGRINFVQGEVDRLKQKYES